MSEPKSLKSQHPQTMGKNKLANPPSRKTDTAPAVEASEPSSVTVPPKQPVPAPSAPVASSPAVSTPKKFTKAGEAEAAIAKALANEITTTAEEEAERKEAVAYYTARAEQLAPKPAPPKDSPPSEPGKDKSYFELTIKLVGSEEPTFTVETPLTGNGAADKANATAVARKRYPGKSMTILNSRIYTKTEGALTEISPGSTLSSLFGATGEVAEDLVEVGKAFHDGSRGTLFLRNLRSHIGLAFRPSLGGLVLFGNRITSNRLASELPLIVAEVLGNNAREIEIFLKP